MIFIVNETNEKLELSTTALDNGASLDLKVGDSAAITIATTSDKEITSEIKKRYSDGEAIKNKLSRHNFKLTASRMYMDNSGETGVNLVAVNPENLPERYKYVKDVIAVVHNSLDEVTMEALQKVTLEGEDLEKFNKLLNMLDEIEDVQNVYHNVEL